MQIAKLVFGFGMLILFAGCSGMYRVASQEEAFGHSTRNMIRTGTHNPAASNAAAAAPVLDGEKAAAALKAYRAGGAEASSSSTPVNISVGE